MRIASSTKTRFVVVDTITGNEVSEVLRFESEALELIPVYEQDDKEAGCYIANSYKVEAVEVI
ncbi:hypothetical protein D0T84_00845 [Dysgonomonas sp. 521]|uniref:hypothetical protein n=1 Tax=Dysgonomonas sp. 521 TaxID=2302932 RepID=UPI0013D8CCF5|nr:hypothetical protein [Dysgonomonas sp. 521]NDV93465.1 hypothetical protein [Dysgonomonas sp. 521]